MDRMIWIVLHKNTSQVVIQPFGLFKGYGLFIGIYPVLLCQSSSLHDEVAAVMKRCFEASRQTGYHIRDERDYYAREDRPEYAPAHELLSRYKTNQRADKHLEMLTAGTSDRLKSIKVTRSVYRYRSRVWGKEEVFRVKKDPECMLLAEAVDEYYQTLIRQS